jgi:hypothetical protein
MDLLQHYEGGWYPAEYLIARVRGRRAYLVSDWNSILFSEGTPETLLPAYYRELMSEHSKEGVWKRMLKEFKWVYLQMNTDLRDIFLPFFIYSEAKTIALCLRYKSGKATVTDMERLLSFSMLSKDVRETLKKETDTALLLDEFERKFLSSSDRPAGLGETFSKNGLKGVEEELTNWFIEEMINSKPHPVIKYFFIVLADIKNIIALYKHARWKIAAHPAFIRGGSISGPELRKTAEEGKLNGVARLIYKLTAVSIHELNISGVENTLYSFLTKKIRTRAREDSDITLLLDYLWRLRIEAQNLSVILYSRGIEGKDIRKELVT